MHIKKNHVRVFESLFIQPQPSIGFVAVAVFKWKRVLRGVTVNLEMPYFLIKKLLVHY